METTCICAVRKTCACCPGSKSSSEYLPISHAHYSTYCFDLKLHLPSSPQQIWPVHKDHRSARRRQAEAVLPVSDRQVLCWNTEVVKQTTDNSRARLWCQKSAHKEDDFICCVTKNNLMCFYFIITLCLDLYRHIISECFSQLLNYPAYILTEYLIHIDNSCS